MSDSPPRSPDDAIGAVLAPLREQVAQLDEALVRNERERETLRERRRKLAAILRAADASYTKPGPNGKGKGKRATAGKGRGASQETIDKVLKLIDAVAPNNGTFTTRQLRDSPGWPKLQISRGSLDNAINALHEDGMLALEKVAAKGGERHLRRVKR